MSTNTARKINTFYEMVGDKLIYDLSNTVEEGNTSNWIHPDIIVVKTDEYELGMAASRDIAEGSRLVVYGGKVFTSIEFDMMDEDLQHYPYQIDRDLFIGPANVFDVGKGERLNHSCNPTAGFRGEITLVAIRNILKGELITIDYATCSSNSHESFLMDCTCMSRKCRKIITGNDWSNPDIINRLFDYYQPYLKAMVYREITLPSKIRHAG